MIVLGYRDWGGAGFLAALLLLFSSAAALQAELKPPAVAISRVETNPPGSDGGREWAELFNSGAFDAEVGGWRIAAARTGAEATIPPGTVVLAGGALKVAFDGGESPSLSDEGESISLLDGSGRAVDETPPLTDSENSNAVWTRLSEEEDALVGGWRFEGLFRRIDDHALRAPPAAEVSLEKLAQYLEDPAKNDEERARAIYRWITDRIEFDVEAAMKGSARGRTPQEVLVDRRGVCSEYSSLFERLCQLSGLEAEVIHGYGKGYGYAVGSKIPNTSNHAWNAVRIDGTWRLVDSTWGAGHLDPEVGYNQRFEEFYFLTPPEDLVWTHLPDDPVLQLLLPQISKEEFEALPYAKPALFRDDMKITGSLAGTIEADGGATVNLSAPSDVGVMAKLLDEEGREISSRFAQVRRSPEGVSVRAACPGPGDYTLRIYSRRSGGEEGDEGGDSMAYEWALDYRIVAGPTAPVPKGYPVVWDLFWELGLDFKSHPEGLIEAGSELSVVLSAPGDVRLLARLLDDGGRELSEERTIAQRVTGEDGRYGVMASFPKAGNYTLRIYAKRCGEAGVEYASVAEYSVVAASGREEAIYPRTTGSFADSGSILIRPLEGRLAAGEAVDFEIIVPGAEDVALITGGDATLLTRDGEIFRGSASPRGEVQVAARFGDVAAYQVLLVYAVV